MPWFATTAARRGVGKPVCLLSGMFPCRAEGSPRRSRRSPKDEDGRGTPCCFRYVTVESTEWAVAPFKEPVTGAAMCVAFLPRIHPRLYSPAGRQFTRLHCAFGPYLCVQLPSTRPQDESLPSATLHATYHGTGLAPAFRPNCSLTELVRLVRCAKRHQQAAGLARHTTNGFTVPTGARGRAPVVP